MLHRFLTIALLGLLAVAGVQANTSGFPGRAEFADVPIYEKAELMKNFRQVVIVDTRSSLEFETLRITGALNIPVADKGFEDEVKALRARTDKPIVFYCNGRTCMKSYLSVRKASAVNIANTFAYDAGMFEWAESYPTHAELLGKSPVQKADIISLAKFKKHLLDPTTFSDEAYGMGTRGLILDVRDKYQRGAAGLFPGAERWASLDDREKLRSYIEQAQKENKTLFIYDEVGKQVRWLQYALERAGVSNYYFMDKGAKAYYADIMKEFKFN